MRALWQLGFGVMALAAVSSCRTSAVVTPVKAGPSSPDPISAESLMSDVELLSGEAFEGRGSYQPGGKRASDFVHDEFVRLGFEVVRQKVRGRHAENIIGIKRGGDEAVIVSAHHDHVGIKNGIVHPGADDNASGLAVLLGLARSRAERRYENTVLFVSFGAEEDALVGSGVYVRDPVWPLDQTRAVINFDMVGRNFFEAGANRASAVSIMGLEFDERVAKVAEEAAAEVGLHVISVPARLLELFGLHDRTDDWWFRRQNIGSIHFSTGLHEDYHQPTDTANKIRPQQMARIAYTAAALLDALANSPRKGDAWRSK